MTAAVLGVVGGCGGVGASRFAATLAAQAARAHGRSVLIDLDPWAGGIDVLLAIESVAGARWSGLRLAGGRLDAATLLSGLPGWGDVAVLAADAPTLPTPAALTQVLAAARQIGPVVLDLARWPSETRSAALSSCELITLVVADDVAGVTAARSVLDGLEGVPAGVLVRGSGRGAGAVAELVGARLLGCLPRVSRREDQLGAPPRRLCAVASGVLDAVRTAA